MIAISGKQGSGKSTLAANLIKTFEANGAHPSVMKFADVLYAMHKACLPILKAAGARPNDMEKDGELLQVLGTEYGRRFLGANVWVDCLIKRINRLHDIEGKVLLFPRPVIVDDMRFENELASMEGALRIRLQAERDVRQQRCSYWRHNEGHPSETELDCHFSKFELALDTSTATAEEISEHVMKYFLKRFEGNEQTIQS